MLRRFHAFLLSLLVFSGMLIGSARAQDTVVVQTLTYDSIGRVGVYQFPPDDGTSYEKVLMQYRMRCHHALVSNGTNTEQGCGQWDYNCESYITDSSRTDSVKSSYPSSIISNYPANTNFPYVTTPTHSLIERDEKSASYSTLQLAGFTPIVLGAGTSRLAQPLNASASASRTFYLLTASELKTKGLGKGPITGMSLAVASAGSPLRALSIRLRQTKSGSVDESLSRDTGYTVVYYSTTSTTIGAQNFYFSQPYIWDTTSNIIVELSYTNLLPGTDNIVLGSSVGTNTTLSTSSNESALAFSGSEGISVAANNFSQITNEITISVWTNGDTSILPANSALLEGTDDKGNRQVNVHLPWSDNNVYWDCGGDAAGYDRVNQVVKKPSISGGWNHWAFTKNAVTGRMQIYLNGSLWLNDTGRHRPINLTKLNLGLSLTSTLGYYGEISRFSIWNKALDSTSIQRIMRSDIQPSDPNIGSLLAYYKMTEGHGSALYDSSAAHATSHVAGVPIWRQVRGRDLYTNFAVSQSRPNITLLQAATNVTPVITDSYPVDTVIDAAHSIIDYRIVSNDSVATVDTLYRWLATNSYTRDETGAIVGSTSVRAQDTIRLTNLFYWQRWPQKFEIMSFVTPYGIGLDLGKSGKLYEFDATDYLPILHGLKKFSMERGSGQEEFDVRFLFIKGTPPRNVLNIQQIWPMTEEPFANIFSDLRYEPREVYFDPQAKGFKLRSMITGHGQQGEFIPRMHHVSVNATKYQWLVYKVCSDNPMYPQGGTWTYNRSGWCPGAPTLETEVELTGTVTPGDSALFDYGVVMDTAQDGAPGDSRYDPSNQLVSYGPPNFTLNAGIVDIQRPSDRISYGRINPACDLPIVVIRNNGANKLTSLHFDYHVDGGPHKTFDWTGSLNFLDTQSVTLPVDSVGFWTSTATGLFHVDISAPNGGQDSYDPDNHFTSTYSHPPSYKGAIVINYHTNNQPADNFYEIRDLAGDTVYQILDTLTDNTLYNDSLSLPTGCYSLIFHDLGEDGLNYWANTAQGTDGYLRIRQSTKTGKILYTQNPDFGKGFQFDFSITQSSLDVVVPPVAFRRTSIYPNPAHDYLNVELEGYKDRSFTLQITDELGRTISSGDYHTDGAGRLHAKLDTRTLAPGRYFLMLISSEGSAEKPFVIE